MKPTVGHFRRHYLNLTETFIYQYLTNHDRYEAFVCGLHSENLEKFPFERRYIFEELSRLNPAFWYYGVQQKFNVGKTYYGRVIEKYDPDVLHAHFGPTGVNLAKYRTSERPLVTSFYGYDASKLVEQNESIREQYRRLFATGDLVLVEGPAMQEKLTDLGCPSSKVALQRIAIDASNIKPVIPTGEEGVTVLMVGRYVEKKGIPDGIRAFAAALGHDPEAELRIVGGDAGEYTQTDLQSLADECGIADRVTFTGYLDHEAYIDEVRCCDILLAPSKTAESGDSEGGAPTVLLEAQASGKPIISTTHADIPYVVEDGSAGLLAEPGDVDTLAENLRRLSGDSDMLARMGKRGRADMLEKHDVSVLVASLEETYESVR